MRVVIDGLPIRATGSLPIVIEHLLHAWAGLDDGDELHLVIGPEAGLDVPPEITVHAVDLGERHYLGRLRAQATVVPRLCRELRADVMLGVLPSTTVNPLPCPRAVIAWDLRHELRPAQFTRQARLLRRASYEVGFRQADAVITISERTRDDLLRSRPWLGRRVLCAAQLGGDHVDRWPAREAGDPYAITFGQWSNKNVGLVVDAWALLHARREAFPLTVVGLGGQARAELAARVAELGLTGLVHPQPWLSDAEFRQCFASASMVVFPSDFEGFGLPAVEAMRLGIPLVITPETALLEVTGGHAAVMDGWDADALAEAVVVARGRSPEQLAAAREHAAAFTWARTAEHTRSALAAVTGVRRSALAHR